MHIIKRKSTSHQLSLVGWLFCSVSGFWMHICEIWACLHVWLFDRRKKCSVESLIYFFLCSFHSSHLVYCSPAFPFMVCSAPLAILTNGMARTTYYANKVHRKKLWCDDDGSSEQKRDERKRKEGNNTTCKLVK